MSGIRTSPPTPPGRCHLTMYSQSQAILGVFLVLTKYQLVHNIHNMKKVKCPCLHLLRRESVNRQKNKRIRRGLEGIKENTLVWNITVKD